MSEKRFVQFDQLNNKKSTLEGIDLSNGFVCDVETGICGPADEMKQDKNVKEEKKNANYDMV